MKTTAKYLFMADTTSFRVETLAFNWLIQN